MVLKPLGESSGDAALVQGYWISRSRLLEDLSVGSPWHGFSESGASGSNCA